MIGIHVVVLLLLMLGAFCAGAGAAMGMLDLHAEHQLSPQARKMRAASVIWLVIAIGIQVVAWLNC